MKIKILIIIVNTFSLEQHTKFNNIKFILNNIFKKYFKKKSNQIIKNQN